MRRFRRLRLGGSSARRRLLIGVSAALVVLVGGVATSVAVTRDGRQRTYRHGTITILTGGTLGIYYSYGVALAAAINHRLDGVEAEALATTASVDNVRQVSRSPNVFAFTAADAASAAVAGRAPFDRPEPIRALARIYDDYMHLVVRADSPIHGVADLAGHRVSLGSDGSGTELIAERMLGVAGLAEGSMTISRLGINESVAALETGDIDAFFWSGGLPTGGITDLAESLPIRLVPLGTLAEPLHSEVDSAYRPGTIPADTYQLAGRPTATPTVAVPDLLVTRADTDPGLVEEVTRVMFDARGEISREIPVANSLDRRSAISTFPVPLAVGALRYYRSTKI